MRSLFLILVTSLIISCIGCQLRDATKQPLAQVPTTLAADTLYIPIHFKPSNDTALALADSLTQVYLTAASRGVYYFELDSHAVYKGYDLGALSLNTTTQGRLIRFKPEHNDYYALYLFLEAKPSQPQTAIEVAFALSEEGVQGEGSSFWVQKDSSAQLYIKQHWVSYHGAEAEAVVSTDRIVQYVLSNNRLIATPITTIQEQKWRRLFEQKEGY